MQIATKEEPVKEKKENLEDAMDKELAGAKTEEEKKAIKARYEDKLSEVKKKIAITDEKIETAEKEPVKPSSVKPKPSPTPAPNPKPNKPEKVWGVVKLAWDETVTKYRTEYVGKYVCESEIGTKYFDEHDDAHDYYVWCGDNRYLCNYYWDDYVLQEQVPYTEVIHHEAVYGWIEN